MQNTFKHACLVRAWFSRHLQRAVVHESCTPGYVFMIVKFLASIAQYSITGLNMFYISTPHIKKQIQLVAFNPQKYQNSRPLCWTQSVTEGGTFSNPSKGGVKNRSLGAGGFLIFACKNVRPPSKVANNLRPLLKVVQTLRPSECFIFNEKVTLICKINIFSSKLQVPSYYFLKNYLEKKYRKSVQKWLGG